MAILKIAKIASLWQRRNLSCNSEIQESRWPQLSQLWQFWKILVTSIVAIMAILKTKNIGIPFHHNCRNYGNSEDKKYMDPFPSQLSQLWQFWKKDTVDSWWQQLLQLWQLWKKQIWIPVTTIVAIMGILKTELYFTKTCVQGQRKTALSFNRIF